MSNQSCLNQIEIWKLWKFDEIWKQSKHIETLWNVWVGHGRSALSYGVHRIYSIGPSDSLINHRSLQPLTSSFFQSGRQMHPASTSWQMALMALMALVLRKTTENPTRTKDEIRMKGPKRCSENGTNFILHSALKCHGRLNTTSHIYIYIIKPGICVVLLPCSPVASFDCLLHLSFSCAKLT